MPPCLLGEQGQQGWLVGWLVDWLVGWFLCYPSISAGFAAVTGTAYGKEANSMRNDSITVVTRAGGTGEGGTKKKGRQPPAWQARQLTGPPERQPQPTTQTHPPGHPQGQRKGA